MSALGKWLGRVQRCHNSPKCGSAYAPEASAGALIASSQILRGSFGLLPARALAQPDRGFAGARVEPFTACPDGWDKSLYTSQNGKLPEVLAGQIDQASNHVVKVSVMSLDCQVSHLERT